MLGKIRNLKKLTGAPFPMYSPILVALLWPQSNTRPDSLILRSVFPPGWSVQVFTLFPTRRFICSFSYVLVQFASDYWLSAMYVLGCSRCWRTAQQWIKQCPCPHVCGGEETMCKWYIMPIYMYIMYKYINMYKYSRPLASIRELF